MLMLRNIYNASSLPFAIMSELFLFVIIAISSRQIEGFVHIPAWGIDFEIGEFVSCILQTQTQFITESMFISVAIKTLQQHS